MLDLTKLLDNVGDISINHLSILLLFSWILLVTRTLISSNIDKIGLNLASIIQLFNDSIMLLSTASQLDLVLNQARD